MEESEMLDQFDRIEKIQAMRIQIIFIQVLVVTLLFVMISGFYWDDQLLVVLSFASGILLMLPYWLIKQGKILASGYMLILIVMGMVTAAATLGHGIHDIAMMAYPIVIIFASLALDRLGFRLTVVLALLSTAWLVFGENSNIFVSQPYLTPNWVDFLVISAVLLAAVFSVNLMASTMRKNMEKAKQELQRRLQVENEVREKEVQYQNLADTGLALIWTSGTDKLCNYFNKPWLQFTGRTLEQEMGNGWAEGVHPDDFDRCLKTYVSAFDNRESFEMEYRLRHVSGDYRWLLDMGTPNYNSFGEFTGYIGHCFDISERKQIEEDLRLKTEEQTHFFNTSLDLFCIADTGGYFLRLNPQWEETLGYSLTELEGKRFLDFVHPEDIEATLLTMSRLESQETILNFENRYRCKDGSYRWIEWRSTPAGKLIYAAARDISERKETEAQLRYQGTHDILTGIYNRAFFEEELTRFERGREYPVSIIMADVDGLKLVNDSQGHAIGDQLLRQSASVLSSVFRAGDVLARIGGDEFGVLLPGTDHSAAEGMVSRIKEKLNEHNKAHPELTVQISIGVATAETGNLMKAFSIADQQMYTEKSRRYSQPLQSSVE